MDDVVQMTTAGAEISRFDFHAIFGEGSPDDLAIRDGNLWLVQKGPALIGKMAAVTPDGWLLSTVSLVGIDPVFDQTEAITYDGTNFWVAAGHDLTVAEPVASFTSSLPRPDSRKVCQPVP